MQPSFDPTDTPGAPCRLTPGQRLARGVIRHLTAAGFACLEEMSPARGLRVDVMALAPRGELWIVECKSSLADFRNDRKWQSYLPWCDSFFWAVDAAFPADILPPENGLFLADAYGAEMMRAPAAPARLAAARRSALTRAFARQAARRLGALRDPGFSAT